MSGSCTVVPGYLLGDGEVLTEAKLRAMAQPAVSVPAGSISDEELNLPAVQAALGTNSRPNLLTNANFVEPRWAALTMDAAAGVETWNAEDWYCKATGGTATFARSTTVPVNGLALHSVEIGGGSGVGVVEIGQNIERALSATLARKVTFSAWIYNNTGATGTPHVLLYTCDSAGDWSALTLQVTTALSSCPNAAWTQVVVVLNCTTLTNLANGLRVAVQFPSGSLDSTGKKWNLAQTKLEVGETASPLSPDIQWPRQQAVAGTAANLVIQNNATNPTYQMDVAADEVVVKDVRGYGLVLTQFSRTADLTLAGLDGLDTGTRAASTWYYLWAVSNGSDARVLFSLSATAPTLPAGYVYKALLGAVYNGSGNTLVTSYQTDRRVFLARTIVFTAQAVATADTLQSISISTLVPPIAKVVIGTGGSSGSSNNARMTLAADSTGLAKVYIVGAGIGSNSTGFSCAAPFRMAMRTAQAIWWTCGDTAATSRLDVTGYEL